MGRLGDRARQRLKEQENQGLSQEIEALQPVAPDTIPPHVWDLVLENGHLATTRLNEILKSPRFQRLRASEQAKLIQLAQDRAYGKPLATKSSAKQVTIINDATASAIPDLASRALLPEYRRSGDMRRSEGGPSQSGGPGSSDGATALSGPENGHSTQSGEDTT